MKEVGKIYFISKKDALFSVLMWGTIAVGFYTMVFPVFLTFSISNFVMLIFGFIIIGWLIWVWFRTGYLVENNTLKIQGGPLKQTVDIQEIKKITKEKSILTAAALSMDRLQIHYGHYKYDLVSPKKEYEFIKLLLSKNPQIQIDDALSKFYNI